MSRWDAAPPPRLPLSDRRVRDQAKDAVAVAVTSVLASSALVGVTTLVMRLMG